MKGFIKRGVLVLFLLLLYFSFNSKEHKGSDISNEQTHKTILVQENNKCKEAINNIENWYITIARKLNLRASPSLDAPILGKLSCFSLLVSNEVSRGWRKVKVYGGTNEGLTGWVSEKYIIPATSILDTDASSKGKPKLREEIKALPKIAEVELVEWKKESVPYLHTFMIKIINHSCLPIKNPKIEVIEYYDKKTEVFRDTKTLRTHISPNDWKRVKFQVLGDENAQLASVRFVSFELSVED